jgi:hypothetical protein
MDLQTLCDLGTFQDNENEPWDNCWGLMYNFPDDTIVMYEDRQVDYIEIKDSEVRLWNLDWARMLTQVNETDDIPVTVFKKI